ncbi:geranyl transferase [Saccharophagus sp. K07]|uniref:polyprenyl synthetase family protein n=1 Tax=Saccharophagus sp. K07 TaxID=2283636 RepID=UPI001651EA6A|nr:farnesyl diphosphate synthase [Saccharophagus sp. K07]MBC6903925.1 geranyl transferase [Saccharophagus sp. K07]
MTPELKQFITTYSRRVNQLLERALPARIPGGERLLDAMSYSLLGAGKRVRPILVYASAEAVNGDMQAALVDACACAVECMHAYSLIHDDLPAMDDDDLRRGEPTCHIAFDEATAILAGDALQCLAFETLLNVDAPASQVVAVARELGRASGATGMVVGQAIDLGAVDTSPSMDLLEQMHVHKTGALIEAAVIMGAVASGIEERKTLRALRTFAKAVGLSFQVQDDILDVTSDTASLGKRTGADQERNKPTYVSLLGLDEAKRKAQQLHEEAIDALAGFGSKAGILRDLSAYIVQRSA